MEIVSQWLPDRSGYFPVCNECGAVIGREDLHQNFHDQLSKYADVIDIYRERLYYGKA